MPSHIPSKPPRQDETRWATDLLRHANLRVTDVRLAALRVLRGSDSALHANQVATGIAAMVKSPTDRVTIYRTLTTLVDAGLAHRVDPGDRVFRYSLTDHSHCRGEQHAHEHAHLVCDSCGLVECLDDAEVVVKPKRTAGAVGSPRKMKITQADVTLHGTCDKCEPAGQTPTPKVAKGRPSPPRPALPFHHPKHA